jgi:hypothetical protein
MAHRLLGLLVAGFVRQPALGDCDHKFSACYLSFKEEGAVF